MKSAVITLGILGLLSILVTQITSSVESKNMNHYIHLNKIRIENNSDLFKIDTLDNEQVLIVEGNTYNKETDPVTGKVIDDVRGKVILLGEERQNYTLTVDMKFLGTHIDMEGAGWFGAVIRARDCDNYEVVWFMPGGTEGSNTVAYVPVAHGIVPWWTEAYGRQEKGNPWIPKDDWFAVRVEVNGDEFSIHVNGMFVFRKKLTYYLKSGRPGFFVGTATDAAFRRIRIEDGDVPDEQ